MPRKKLQLKSFLYISCFCISLLPITTYLIISLFIYGRGLDTINKANLIKSALDFHEKKLTSPTNIKVIEDRKFIPEPLNSLLPEHLENGTLYRMAITSASGDIENVFFLIKQNIGSSEYISYQKIDASEAEQFIKPEVIQMLWILGISSIILLISLLILIKLVIYKVESPITKFDNWASNISPENLNDPLPNLVYPELYSIAELIKSKFYAEYKRIESEEQFWKFCSHELRTPISVIRIGIELLQRYIDKGEIDPIKLKPTIFKLKKSSHTLSHIIETILWINRDNCEVPKQEVDLSGIIADIINDFKNIYLIDNCNIHIYTSPYILRQPDLAVRIVVENLIRNAFQHSIGEEINIIQFKDTVKIINKQMPSHLDPTNTGFGLGHELITRLANKLGWELKFMANDCYHIVVVKFSEKVQKSMLS